MARFKNNSTFCLFVINSRNSFIVVIFIHIFTIYGKGLVLASYFFLTAIKTLNRDACMCVACQVLNYAFILETEDSRPVIIYDGYCGLCVKSS